MNHSSYRIYLTQSHEVSKCISKSYAVGGYFGAESLNREILSVSIGAVCKDERIPEIYHGQNMYFCAVEYRNGDGREKPEYQITFA